MWAYQQEQIRLERRREGKHGQDPNPKSQYVEDIHHMLQHKSEEAMNNGITQYIILTGDMNVNWTGDKKITTEWKNNMEENNMTNVMEWKWPNNKTWTYETDGGKTWIDHTLVSQQLIIDGAINKAGVETHHTFYTSDHNLCAINLNVNKIIGKVQRVTCVKDVRRRMLRSTDTLSAKRYAEEIDYIEKKEKQGTSLRTDVRRLYADALKYKRTMKGKLKRKFDQRANKLMRREVKRLLQAETKAHNAQARMKGRRKAYWSDWMAGREVVLEALLKIVRKSTVRSKRHQVAKQVKRARKVGLTGELEEQLRTCPSVKAPNRAWDTFATKMREHINKAQKQLSARIRRKVKMGVKEKIKLRLNQYKNNRMLGPFLRYAVQRKGRRGMPTTLVDYTEQGARIIDKPSDIKKKNVELTEEHMGKGRQTYFIHNHKLMRENTRSSKKWKK